MALFKIVDLPKLDPTGMCQITEIEQSRDILHSDTDLAERLRHIASAWQASKVRDHPSMIKHLVLACNEEPTGVLEKFKYIRHALSHTKGPLRPDTVKGLKQFGSRCFTLTGDGRFDFESASNLHHMEVQAGKFLAHMHNCLKKELRQMEERSSDG